MTDWKKIRSEYIRGGISYRKLAEKYNVSPASVNRRMRTEGWSKLRSQKELKSNALIVESSAKRDASDAERIQTVADVLLSKIEDGVNDGSLLKTSKDAKALISALKDLRDIKGIKSDLDIEEQKARIDKLRSDSKVGAGDESETGVVIMPAIVEVEPPEEESDG